MQTNTTKGDPVQLTREVTELIKSQLLVEVNSPEDDLLTSGVLDSLTLVQLLFDLERRFGVTIPLEELEIEDFRSISSIVRLVQAHNGIPASEGKARAVFADSVLGGDLSSS